MRGKGFTKVAVILCSAFLLSGCGEAFPELTDEQYNQTIEFAVGLLMKYSNNGQEKLTYVDAKEIQKERDKEARKAAKEKKDEEAAQKLSSNTQKDTITDTNAEKSADESTESTSEQYALNDGSETGEDEPLSSSTGSSEESSDTQSDKSADTSTITLSSDESQEIFDNIFLSYQGYSISSTYPESSKSYVVNADKGKKLLVLRFDLYNAGDSSQQVNMLNLNLLFQIILNGKNLGYSSVTFLPNDLSSYIGTIESKAHESLVVLTQIDESNASRLETLGLIVTGNGMQQTVELQ